MQWLVLTQDRPQQARTSPKISTFYFSIAYSIPSFMNPERQEEWQVILIQTSTAHAYYEEMEWENMQKNDIAKI